MRENDLSERLLNYAVRIVKLVEALPRTIVGKRIGDQLLRSGTSAGANYEEAQGAESANDFVHKLQIALKEMRESYYWLRLLDRAAVFPSGKLKELLSEADQLCKILSKAVATAKGKAKPKAPGTQSDATPSTVETTSDSK